MDRTQNLPRSYRPRRMPKSHYRYQILLLALLIPLTLVPPAVAILTVVIATCENQMLLLSPLTPISTIQAVPPLLIKVWGGCIYWMESQEGWEIQGLAFPTSVVRNSLCLRSADRTGEGHSSHVKRGSRGWPKRITNVYPQQNKTAVYKNVQLIPFTSSRNKYLDVFNFKDVSFLLFLLTKIKFCLGLKKNPLLISMRFNECPHRFFLTHFL